MASSGRLAVLLAVMAALACAHTVSVRVCAPSTDATACEAALTAHEGAGTPVEDGFHCLPGGSAEGCAKMVADGEADITGLGGEALFHARHDFNLTGALVEQYAGMDGVPASYYAVGVVKRELCESAPGFTLKDLMGKKSCHTGFRKTSGWILPVGYMLKNGVIPRGNFSDAQATLNDNVTPDAAAVVQYFAPGGVCATGVTSEGPRFGADNSTVVEPSLCSTCITAAGEPTCDADANAYGGYLGAVRCMLESAGDVAFVKHSTLDAWNSNAGNSTDSVDKADFMIVDMGGCHAVSDYAARNLGESPAKTIVARADWAAANTAALDYMGSSSFLEDAQAAGLVSSRASELERVADSEMWLSMYFKAYEQYDAIHDLDEAAALRRARGASGGSLPRKLSFKA